MATDIVQSLFGVTPDMYRQQQAAEADRRALAMAQLTPFQRAEFNIGRGAYQLAGALGGEDPQLKLISLRQSIARDLDPTDPASVRNAIQILKDRDPEGALLLTQEYRKALESGALVTQREAAARASEAAATRERAQAIPADILKAERIAQLKQQRNQVVQAAGSDMAGEVSKQLESIDAQLAALEGKKETGTEAERNARTYALTFGAEGSPEFATAFKQRFTQLTDKDREAKISVVGVATGTRNPVYLDANTNEQFTFVTDAQGKQVRKPYVGGVDRTTANVSASSTQVQETAERKKRGELLVEEYKTISDQARTASKALPALEANLATLDRGFDTGFGTEAKAVGARVLASLGVKDAVQFATDAQTFLANASAAVLQRQLEQKGPQTEADAQRITQTGAQLGNTKEANRFLLSVAKAQLKRDIAQRKFYSDWFGDKKTYDGAEEAWYASEGGKSLFETPELKAYASRGGSGAAAQIPTTPAATAPSMPPGFRVIRPQQP